jgi:hypothetical protein
MAVVLLLMIVPLPTLLLDWLLSIDIGLAVGAAAHGRLRATAGADCHQPADVRKPGKHRRRPRPAA